MNTYEELTLRQQRSELQREQEQNKTPIWKMDRQAYEHLTNDTGRYEPFLENLNQQLETLNQIRGSGRPAQLTPAQQESGRYENVGHFDKKARKKSAKEAMALTDKAKKLQVKMEQRQGLSALPYDIEMTKYMEQAELESLKANGYKENNPRYLRTRLKYLRHMEVILEKAMSDRELTETQIEALVKSYQDVENKIDSILSVQYLREAYSDGYSQEVDRQLEKPELSKKEAQALMDRSLKLLKREDIDLLSPRVFSARLVRVNEQQAEEFLRENQVQEQQQETVSREQEERTDRQLEILQNHKSSDFEPEENEDTRLIDELLEEIVRHKEELGGSPNFGEALPSYQQNRGTICGYPMEAFEAFCREHINKAGNFITRGFFKVLAKVGGIREEAMASTPYEQACLQLQSLKALAQKKSVLERMFTEADNYADRSDVASACGAFFADISRIACHVSYNRPAGILNAVHTHFDMLRMQFPHEREAGRLTEFFSALHGVCFEDRTRILQEYCEEHPVEGPVMREVPQDGHLYVSDISFLPDVNSQMDYGDVACKWIGQIVLSHRMSREQQDALTMEDVLPCLIYEMSGKTYMDIDENGESKDTPVEITEDMLRSEQFKNILVDVLMVLES